MNFDEGETTMTTATERTALVLGGTTAAVVTQDEAVGSVRGSNIPVTVTLPAKPDGAPLSLDAQRMRDAMSAAAPLPLDALCTKTGLPPPKAMAALTELELAGSRVPLIIITHEANEQAIRAALAKFDPEVCTVENMIRVE